MRWSAAVYGATGYLGSEAVRRLLAHPQIDVTHVFAADHCGRPLGEALPNLEGKTSLRVSEVQLDQKPPSVDVLLLALPHAASHEVVRKVKDGSQRIIDMSGAFRVDDPQAYAIANGEEHPLPELLQEFVYGLPEVNGARLRGARFVASPGCFATAVTLGLLPLARAGWLSGDVQSVGVTGSSGAGAAPGLTTHHASRAGNVRAYRPLRHAHVPEIEEILGQCGSPGVRLSFVPVAGPYVRGILATSFAKVPAEVTEEQLRNAFEKLAEHPFVIHPARRLPEVIAVAGSNYAEIGFELGEAQDGFRTVSCLTAVDNLVKGGAGQAIQNLNLMLGLPETMGLEQPGRYP